MRIQILIPFSLMLLALSQDSLAQDLEVQLEKCAKIEARNERLDCYDELSGRQLQPEMQQEVTGQSLTGGEWQLTRETSPIDDSEIAYLSLVASETAPTAPRRNEPTLFIRCKEKRLESFIDWGVPVGIQVAAVTTRLDDGKAETKKWTASSDLFSTFVHGSHSVFVAQLRVHNRLVARLVPLGHSETTATFNLAGLNEVIGDVLAACKR